MPGHKKASASDVVEAPKVQQTAPTVTSAPVAAPTPAPTAAPTGTPAPGPDAQALAHAKAQRLAQEKAAAEKAAAEAAAAAQRKADLDAVEHRIDQLTGRAGAVNASLNTLQRQQNAAGYGLRGDMASAQSRLNVDLAKAQDAIQHEDLDRARRYAAQTESDLETLEKFLGR
jgi:membrane protein involved in colicin uptake